MKGSQYLKAFRVEEWKLRESPFLALLPEKKEEVSSKISSILCHVLSFGTLKLCFHEGDETLLRKQIWRDLAKFTVENKQAETIQTHEFLISYSQEQSIPLINPPGLIETIFMGSKRVIFFGLLWPEICPEIAELSHMDQKKIGVSNVLLLGSVEEFLKTPLQKRQVMTILDGWR